MGFGLCGEAILGIGETVIFAAWSWPCRQPCDFAEDLLVGEFATYAAAAADEKALADKLQWIALKEPGMVEVVAWADKAILPHEEGVAADAKDGHKLNVPSDELLHGFEGSVAFYCEDATLGGDDLIGDVCLSGFGWHELKPPSKVFWLLVGHWLGPLVARATHEAKAQGR